MSDDNGSAVKYEVDSFTVYDVYRVPAEVVKLRDRVAELEAQLSQANAVLRAAKEMYERSILTAGGDPVAWANYVSGRECFIQAYREARGRDAD